MFLSCADISGIGSTSTLSVSGVASVLKNIEVGLMTTGTGIVYDTTRPSWVSTSRTSAVSFAGHAANVDDVAVGTLDMLQTIRQSSKI